MNEIGKVLVVVGLIVVIAGLVLWSGIGRNWLGKLPGDIHVSKGNVQFYFPIVTCLIISIVLTILFNVFRK